MAENLPPLLDLDPVDAHRYRGQPEHEGDAARNVVFGGQILAQMIMAAHLDRTGSRGDDQPDDKEVKSIHAVFARAGDYGVPIDYEVDRMHDGRTVGSDTVTFSQRDKIMSRALILWSVDEPDLITHTELVAMPEVAGPDHPSHRPDFRAIPGAEALVVHGVPSWDDDGPARLPIQFVWTRFPGLVEQRPVVHQAILSWATDGFIIGTAMLPHPGVNESQAHKTISTGVISHTLNFHQRFDAAEWLLLSNEAIWAGRGRVHGRANVWTRDGQLVATYTQDALIRGWADGKDHTRDYQTIM